MSQVQLAICQDKRLLNRSLVELDPQYITAFACQFLNVLAIPKELDKYIFRLMTTFTRRFQRSSLTRNRVNLARKLFSALRSAKG